jgi:hypothetical protein
MFPFVLSPSEERIVNTEEYWLPPRDSNPDMLIQSELIALPADTVSSTT